MLLNLKQIGDFKRDGFLILRSFIENKIIDQWRKQFWKQVDGCYTDKSSWARASSANNPKLTPELGSLPKIESIMEQVSGYNFKGGGCGILTRWPNKDNNSWVMPVSGHLDGYPGEGCQAVLMIGMTTYLYDVQPRGGSFVFWPGSHIDAHQYFLRHPERIEGTFRDTVEWKENGWSIFYGPNSQPAQEFIAEAGDIIIWHGWLMHTGSSNNQSTPRIGLFARWTHHDDAGVRKNIPKHLWDYWTI